MKGLKLIKNKLFLMISNFFTLPLKYAKTTNTTHWSKKRFLIMILILGRLIYNSLSTKNNNCF